jgi:hypothetical protein
MDFVGYVLALVFAVALAVGAYQVAFRRIDFNANMVALIGLGFLGTWGGSRLFGGSSLLVRPARPSVASIF